MGDEVVAEKGIAKVSEQKMWPIFAVGFGLMAFGFYFVFADAPVGIGAEEAVAKPIDTSPFPDLESTVDEPITLEYGTESRSFEIEMQQTARRSNDKPLQTTIKLKMTEEPVAARDGEAYAYLRSFTSVRVAVRTGDEPVGKDVTNEVVRLLEATQLELGYTRNGERVRVEVVSSESAQMRPTLDLINDATRLLFPPLPVEPVNVSEVWSIRVPAELIGTEFVEVEGSTEISTTLAAATDAAARLDATFDGEIRTTWDDAESRRGHLETVISGKGGWHWDRTTGQPIKARATLTRQTLEPDGEKLESAIIVLTARAL